MDSDVLLPDFSNTIPEHFSIVDDNDKSMTHKEYFKKNVEHGMFLQGTLSKKKKKMNEEWPKCQQRQRI